MMFKANTSNTTADNPLTDNPLTDNPITRQLDGRGDTSNLTRFYLFELKLFSPQMPWWPVLCVVELLCAEWYRCRSVASSGCRIFRLWRCRIVALSSYRVIEWLSCRIIALSSCRGVQWLRRVIGLSIRPNNFQVPIKFFAFGYTHRWRFHYICVLWRKSCSAKYHQLDGKE